MACVQDECDALLHQSSDEDGCRVVESKQKASRCGHVVGLSIVVGVILVLFCSQLGVGKDSHPTKSKGLEGVISLAHTTACKSSIPPLKLLTLANQNLGGFGPDEDGPENLRYASVTELDGKQIDLVVSTMDSGYKPMSGDKSGLKGAFGRLNIQPNHNTQLKFQFVESGTDIPITLDKFAFTFYDIDGKMDTETLDVCGGKLLLEEHSRLKSTTIGDCTAVTSGIDGAGVGNPNSISSLTVAQREVSATYTFENRDSIVVKLTTHSKGGRNFFFSGVPVLACPLPTTPEEPPTSSTSEETSPEPSPVEPPFAPETPSETPSTPSTPECSSEIPALNLLTLANQNLGGFGPDKDSPKNLRYASVTELEGKQIDLVVSTMDHGYAPMSGDKSGLKQSFGRLNIQPDHSTKLKFQFVESGTDTPIALKKFAFTFYDIDGKVGTETLEVCEGELLLDEHSSLRSTKTGQCTRVSSGADGAGVPNPQTPSSLTAAQKAVSAMYKFENRDSFEVSLTTRSKGGRNFFFSGFPILDC